MNDYFKGAGERNKKNKTSAESFSETSSQALVNKLISPPAAWVVSI